MKDRENRIGSGMKYFLEKEAERPGWVRRPSFAGTINVDADALLPPEEIGKSHDPYAKCTCSTDVKTYFTPNSCILHAL